MVKLVVFGDTDTTSGAKKVQGAIKTNEQNVDLYGGLGDYPYSGSSTAWCSMMDSFYDKTMKSKLLLNQGNHEDEESETEQSQKDIEEWVNDWNASNPDALMPKLDETPAEAKVTTSGWENATWLTYRIVGNVFYFNMNTQDQDVEFERGQFNWVKAKIEEAKTLKAQGKIDWIVGTAHKPWFTEKSSHSPYTAVRKIYYKMFEDVVDFMLHGHNHNTQLWKPMTVDPNQGGNGAGIPKFTLASDGKTFDFSKPHGWFTIVSGHAGHEWNGIKEQNQNVMHHRDSGEFGYTVLEFNGKNCKVTSKDATNKVHFEYNVTKDGSGPQPTPDPVAIITPENPIGQENTTITISGANSQHTTTYKWTVTNAQIIGADNLSTVQVKLGSSAASITLTATNTEGKSNSITKNIIVTTTPPPTDVICPENYHYDTNLKRCIPDLEPQVPPKCPAGTKWNPTTKICEKIDVPPGDPQAIIKPDNLTGQAGTTITVDGSQSKNANTYLWSTSPPTSIIGSNSGQTVQVQLPSDHTAPSSITLTVSNGTKSNSTAKNITVTQIPPPPGCPSGQCKDSTTGQCRPIASDEEVDANGFCKKKPTTGDVFDEFGMKILAGKPTGNKKAMEWGTDHRNGQRFNVNHEYHNYIMQGYYKTGQGQAAINHKGDGPNHGGCTNKSICLWYEFHVELSDGKGTLQFENPHPDNHDVPDSALEMQDSVGPIQQGKWIGWATAYYWGPDGKRHMKSFVDPNPFDAAGKPLNNWKQVCFAIERGQICSTINHPRDLQAVIDHDAGFESEIRMHGATNHDTDMKNAWVIELEQQGTPS